MTFDITELGVYQVFTGGGTGTGFLIAPTILVTNAHVVAPYRQVAVELRDRRRVLGEVRRIAPERDLAIVELTAPVAGQILSIAGSGELKPNQPISIVGFPVGLPLSITDGVVSNPRQLLDGQHFVQTDAAINPGNSGGPMLDATRHIVAVTTCKLRAAENVGFGIPGADAQAFIDGFHAQAAPFGVLCPACDALLESARRYCDHCGTDLEELDLTTYFDPPAPHPMVEFVEDALARAGVDPILARHGAHNWSFYSGSAPIEIWSCCSEHLCFASPLAKPGKQRLGELFRYLLSAEHAPLAFDLDDNIIRLHLTFHASDVFARADRAELAGWIADFVAAADRFDNQLAADFGCEPAPATQLTFWKEQART
ncbi:MAG: serine protease [Kofleriaceae bacterium]|jgi:serine protease Do|nr:serine protease [Kofleriaceae bacterium]MBP9169944.1 serine protease [Kofleriaceae bacterium]MBP9858352.1 serine protease [Kofleriaceae bacterium]